jgi:hypothetical protein
MSLAIQSGFTDNELATLKQLEILLNYNAYGATVDDLFFHPAKLFEKLLTFATPFDFLADDQETHQVLVEGYTHETNDIVIIQLPDEACEEGSAVFLVTTWPIIILTEQMLH